MVSRPDRLHILFGELTNMLIELGQIIHNFAGDIRK
jgi:hypothetical protein